MRTAILTISTSLARGEGQDASGEALAELAAGAGAEIIARELATDDKAAIQQALQAQIAGGAQLILTTGGTGLTPDDVTPEATLAVIDRAIPGIAEAMRAESLKHTPMGMLSRGVAGAAGETLIINFPGNPKAIRQLFGLIAPTLAHAVALLRREGGRGAGAGH